MEALEIHQPHSKAQKDPQHSQQQRNLPNFKKMTTYPEFVDLTDSPASVASSSNSPVIMSQQSQGSRSSSQTNGPYQHALTGSPWRPQSSRPYGQQTNPAVNKDYPNMSYKQSSQRPLGISDTHNSSQPASQHSQQRIPSDSGGTFGSSIIKSKPSNRSQPNRPPHMGGGGSQGYDGFIKPATPNAFRGYDSPGNKFAPTYRPRPEVSNNDWPAWLTNGQPNPGIMPPKKQIPAISKPSQSRDDPDANPTEEFDLGAARITAEDYATFDGDADKHMRELLSGAIGDGEDEMGDDAVKEGEEIVKGFAADIRLMPHQVRGVRWMRNRESGRKYGGILADDMGLGKTVQTLARIVEGVATAAEKKAGFRGGTLIIAPLAVMEQWATEVRTKTKKGLLKVTTHHGPSRAKMGKILEEYDVVITTFQTVASEHGNHEHLRQPTVRDASPDSDDSDESSVFKKITKKPVKGKAKKASSALFEVKWLRIVVDEAQNIKNRKTKAAKAAVALKAKYRWCLTGTPIQNNVEELFSLFQFLGAKPLDNWETFRDRIVVQVKNGKTGVAMKRLHVVLKAVMLRRTKDATIDGKPILNLPGRQVDVIQCPFDTEEREFYEALQKQTQVTFNKFVRAGSVMSNFTSVLTMLLRLRQACDHPALVTSSWTVDKDAIDNKAAEPADDQPEEDPLADELANLMDGLGVGAKKCDICFASLAPGVNAKHCDACAEITADAALKAKEVEAEDGLPPYSAKIRMLLKLLRNVEETSGKKEKTIVFSQFTSFLNLIEPFLKQAGIAYVRYDGSMRNDKRQESLEKIKTSPDIRVILISFKAGSTGLNLTCCNHVVLMDLWWNPALEDQAFDRAHRLGQKLDVKIYKLTIDETVEDRILELQNQKRELARAALSGEGAKNIAKLSLNDIMALFKAN